MPSVSVYQLVTDRIMESLRQGTIPWRQPWSSDGGGRAVSLSTGKPYRGVNQFLLSAASYASPFWGTYKQIQAQGGQVRKGETGTPVVFWKWPTPAEKAKLEAEGKYAGPILRYYTVFNAEQADGLELPAPAPRTELERIQSAEDILSAMPNPPTLAHGGDRAYYRPSTDHVQMPPRASFRRTGDYYAVRFHELAHATGHASRLNRDEVTHLQPFGSPDYSREELVAEMAAAMLCAVAGIDAPVVNNQAAYIQNWLEKLGGDVRLVLTAAARAQHAADYIQRLKVASEEPAAEMAMAA